jgi:hypothetical protein
MGKTEVTARAKRWDHGWELHIDGFGVTQCGEHLDDAAGMVRDYVALATGEAPESFRVNVVVNGFPRVATCTDCGSTFTQLRDDDLTCLDCFSCAWQSAQGEELPPEAIEALQDPAVYLAGFESWEDADADEWVTA